MSNIKYILYSALAFLLLPAWAFSQFTICDFSGTATYKGRNVNSGDVIRAFGTTGDYTSGSVFIGANGAYLIHVKGNDPTTPEKDGANEGEAITFRINGEVASVVSGSNTWTANGSKTCNIDVPDLPPLAVHNGPYTGQEGSPVSFNGTGSRGATFTWTFGDGGTGSGLTPTHTYGDNGTYTVSLTAQNLSGQTDTKSTTATISNVAPTVNAGTDKSSNEGDAVSFSGTYTDPGTNDAPFTISWTFGDGGTASGSLTPSHTYMDNGTFNVVLSVRDKNNGTGTDNLTVTVANLPPQNVNAGNDKTANEGDLVSFSGSATDPGSDPLTYSWNFGDGTALVQGQNVTHRFQDNGTFTVTLTVNDGDGGTATDQLTVTVNNVAPTADAGGPYQGVINYQIQFNGGVSDPGGNDTHTFEWDLDDDGQYDDSNQRYPYKTYTAAGTYQVHVRVTDDDGGSDTDDATVTVSEGMAVTITTEPVTGVQIVVDGETFMSPKTFYWPPASSHSIAAANFHSISDQVRYHFNNWSDGKAREHSITVPSTPLTLTASYLIEYFLDINTQDKDAHSVGEGWYYKGTKVNISVDDAVLGLKGTTRYKFAGWTGYGSGSYTGPYREVQVTVNEPLIQTADWDEEYLVEVISPYGTTSGGGWKKTGQLASILVSPPFVEGSEGSRHTFQRWEGVGPGSYTGPNNPTTFIVGGPIAETAVWQNQYYLTVVSEYGQPTGSGWFNEGDKASVSVDTSVSGGPGTVIRFTGWVGTGFGAYTGGDNAFEVTMNAPVKETAQWKTQYQLSVSSDRGNPQGDGWYDNNTQVVFEVDSMVVVNDSVRYRFAGWQGTGTNSYTGLQRNPTILMKGPVQETALWNLEYRILVDVEPEGAGTVQPFIQGRGWGVAGQKTKITAIGNSQEGYGFTGWTGDTTAITNPLMLFMSGPKSLTANFIKGRVIVASDPPGRRIVVDSEEMTTPVVFNWAPGSTHTLNAVSPQEEGADTRYTFESWSDHKAQEHTILVPDTAVTYMAVFGASYLLKVESTHGTPMPDSLWVGEGQQITVSIEDSVKEGSGDILYLFTGWTGTGSGSYTGPLLEAQVTMNEPVVQHANWKSQFRLVASTFPVNVQGASVAVSPSGPWYDSGSRVKVTLTVQDPTYKFTGWSGSASGTANPLWVTVQGPMSVVANLDIPNMPPTIQNFPNLVMFEDEIYNRSFDWLSNYIKDPNEPIDVLNLTFETTAPVTFTVDSLGRSVRIEPADNWYGKAMVDLAVVDNFGQMATASFLLTVQSVNDPPEPFELLFPPKDTMITEWFWPMTFKWQKTLDVDEGDSVMYSFYYSPFHSLRGPGTVGVSFLTDTTLMLNVQKPGVYYWGVYAEDPEKLETRCSEVFQISISTGVEEEKKTLPDDFSLDQNYPNPFNPLTTIQYSLPGTETVHLWVLDIRGRVVRRLVEEKQPAGRYSVIWDATDDRSMPVASGMYFIRIEAGRFIENRKMIFLR